MTQISTIDALLTGIFDGTVTCKKLREYGDFGVGTFESVDGEMIVLDGDIYQVRADGVAYPAGDDTIVPFASVTYFEPDSTVKLESGLDFSGLEKTLDAVIPENLFSAILIRGEFSYMKTRSLYKQHKPYPPLVEVTRKQAVFEFNNIRGTIVGFKTPTFVSGVNIPGYHIHFLTEDRKAGGHILELKTGEATATLDNTPEFLMLLPEEGSRFYQTDFTSNRENELKEVEK
ncbi:MAG: acetolactate decarboxylase [Dehalococcoidales bacterium]|nr:acetolactate decarboxylase [Dehalococcoidales bacterium]